MFSFEALALCATALGAEVWIGLMLRSTNVFAAALAMWCAVVCAGTSMLYLARWFALP